MKKINTQPEKFIGAHPPDIPISTVEQLVKDAFGLTCKCEPLWGERDQNFVVHTDSGPQGVLKISNALEEPEELDLQLQAMKWLHQFSPDLPTPRLVKTLDGKEITQCAGADGDNHTVHMITHLPGIQLAKAETTPEVFNAVGRKAGALANALRGFHHSAAGHALFWDIRHIGSFVAHASRIPDRDLAKRVSDIADHFSIMIKPALARLRAQIIHHDTNTSNILVDPREPARITGLIDFGDLIHGPITQDVAVAALETVAGSPDPLADAAHIIAGYDSVVPLEELEIDLIYDLMVARASLGLLIGTTRVNFGVTSAHDQDYFDLYIPLLDAFLTAGRDATRDTFRDACRFPVYTPTPPRPQGTSLKKTEKLIKRRHVVLGTELPLTYSNPLHTEKGQGVWLYDVDGRPHLDCYNNVAHLGHCHPHIVRTVSHQLATLNTNTRYVFESVVAYAERLSAHMPGDLGACIVVNSGSEAVDLALRMAKTVSGQDGMLAMEGAYHGITVESYAVSPSTEWDARDGGRTSHISDDRPDIDFLINPDTVRGPYTKEMPDADCRYAADADRAIAKLTQAGHPPGAFIVDTAFSSSGIIDVSAKYLSSVVAKVRDAGGMIISDEVQYGFGRSGEHFWGFEGYDFTPDFVALGKPMGNGIAVGCLVTTPQILERFNAHHAFFSTFGGNPVACAASAAVLDVLERENLQQNALEIGTYIMESIREVGHDSGCIGEVRGRGFFIGVDIVSNKASMEPDGNRCNAIKNYLRDHGILVSSDGFHDNVLKIRPPMIFTKANADTLIEGMRQAIMKT
ncbi:MAG: aminotransferase class III-fold pyridoxal phosphate-dependent enzyme [Alphaproteobacteria bacterium]